MTCWISLVSGVPSLWPPGDPHTLGTRQAPASADGHETDPLLLIQSRPAVRVNTFYPHLLSMNCGCCQALACQAQRFTTILPAWVWGVWSRKVLASTSFQAGPEPTPPHLLIASRPQNWPGCGQRPSPDLGPRPREYPACHACAAPSRVGSPARGLAPLCP